MIGQDQDLQFDRYFKLGINKLFLFFKFFKFYTKYNCLFHHHSRQSHQTQLIFIFSFK